jgi:hypothetical protein
VALLLWVNHEDPERRRLGQLVAKEKLLDAATVKSYVSKTTGV